MAGGGRVPVTGTMTSLQAATLGPSGGVVAGLFVSGGLGVTLPCASAKRSRLLPEVFDDCSSVSRRRSLRDGAIIREVSETAIALNFLEASGTNCSESCEKVGYSMLSTDLASPALRRLRFVISECRPPNVSESGEAEKVGYSKLSADLAPPTLRRLHLVIFDFRPPSVSESGEAAARELCHGRLFVHF